MKSEAGLKYIVYDCRFSTACAASITHKSRFFHMYQLSKFALSYAKSGRPVLIAKGCS